MRETKGDLLPIFSVIKSTESEILPGPKKNIVLMEKNEGKKELNKIPLIVFHVGEDRYENYIDEFRFCLMTPRPGWNPEWFWSL